MLNNDARTFQDIILILCKGSLELEVGKVFHSLDITGDFSLKDFKSCEDIQERM